MSEMAVGLAFSGVVFLFLAAIMGVATDSARTIRNTKRYARAGLASLGISAALFLAAIWVWVLA